MSLDFLSNMQIGSIVAIFTGVFLLICLVGYLSKKGLLSFSGKGLSVGGKWQTLERTIIRQQMQYVAAAIEECFSETKREKTWNEWKSRYVAERVKDVLEEAISYNHISSNASYIKVKQKSVWAAIQENSMESPYYKSEEFKSLIYNWVEKTLTDLIAIREFYIEQNK